MRKGLLIAIVVTGSAITGSAQSSPGFSLDMTATQVQRIDDHTTFPGGVEFVISGVRVRADNATFHTDTNTVDLSGHVQLTLPPK